ARWDGDTWHDMGGGMNDAVAALAEYNGDLVAGGWFQTAGGVPARYIAAWNGTSWRPLATPNDLNGVVRALYALRDTLYVGGSFDMAAGFQATHVARWDGTRWSPMGAGLGEFSTEPVLAFTTFNDQLVAG